MFKRKPFKIVVEPSVSIKLLLAAIDRLYEVRLRDVTRREDSTRILVKMLKTRGDISRNAQERGDNWKDVAVRLGRKSRILESRIRHDDQLLAGVNFREP